MSACEGASCERPSEKTTIPLIGFVPLLLSAVCSADEIDVLALLVIESGSISSVSSGFARFEYAYASIVDL